MDTRYIQSFYIDMQGFTFRLRISNLTDTNTLKAAQSDSNIKSSNSKQLSRFFSTYLTYIPVYLLNTRCHTERMAETLESQIVDG